MAQELKAGNAAPAFSLALAGGGAATLEGAGDGGLVLYFYPKADTTGCTKEAEAFSALQPQFAKLGVTVLGVSADPVSKLTKFRDKYRLAIPLASDESGASLRAYGVWAEKSMYGRKFMGIERSTFLIGPDRRIAEVWRKVKVDGHAEAVLEVAKRAAAPR